MDFKSAPALNARASASGMSPTMAGAAALCRHKDPVDLSVGEPCILPPLPVREAAASAAMEGRSRFGPAAGMPRLRDLVAQDLARRDGIPRAAEDVIITAGGKPAILDALRCILEPGDEVLIFAPYWPTFLEQVRWAGGVPVVVACDPDLMPDRSALEEAFGPRTRAVIVNQPSNPSGLAWDAARIKQLAQLALERQAWVIVDQVYGTLTLQGREEPLLQAAPELAEQCLVVESFSKRFAMTGYRLGAAGGPRRLINAMVTLGATSVTHASTISQHAGIAAMEMHGTWERDMLGELRVNKGRMSLAFQDLPGIHLREPEGGLYLFPDVSEWCAAHGVASDSLLVARLRDEAGVKTLPGSVFGALGHLRLCFAADGDRLERAAQRLKTFFLNPA